MVRSEGLADFVSCLLLIDKMSRVEKFDLAGKSVGGLDFEISLCTRECLSDDN